MLAREIGHVVSQHHEENTGTSLAVSLVATVLAPVTTVARYLTSVYSGVTTAIASASVTAASFASSKVLIASCCPRQLEEADKVARNLLASSGVGLEETIAGFASDELRRQDAEWLRELWRSVDGLKERLAAVPLDRVIR